MPAAVADGVVEWGADRSAGVVEVGAAVDRARRRRPRRRCSPPSAAASRAPRLVVDAVIRRCMTQVCIRARDSAGASDTETYNTYMYKEAVNPFTYGALALDDAFTDREPELKELLADIRNGQDVLVFAPRRYGKSSLVLRAAQQALAKRRPRRLLRPDEDADEGALRGRPREDDLRRPRLAGRPGGREGGRALPRASHHADDRDRPRRREPALHASTRAAPRSRDRRHDRGAARAARQDRRRAQAASRARLRRVPGGAWRSTRSSRT